MTPTPFLPASPLCPRTSPHLPLLVLASLCSQHSKPCSPCTHISPHPALPVERPGGNVPRNCRHHASPAMCGPCTLPACFPSPYSQLSTHASCTFSHLALPVGHHHGSCAQGALVVPQGLHAPAQRHEAAVDGRALLHARPGVASPASPLRPCTQPMRIRVWASLQCLHARPRICRPASPLRPCTWAHEGLGSEGAGSRFTGDSSLSMQQAAQDLSVQAWEVQLRSWLSCWVPGP